MITRVACALSAFLALFAIYLIGDIAALWAFHGVTYPGHWGLILPVSFAAGAALGGLGVGLTIR